MQHHSCSFYFPTLWCHRQVVISRTAEELRGPRRPVPFFFFPFPFVFFSTSPKTAEVPVLWWEGRAGGDVAVYFPSVCACESDYRSLSQYLASADGIIAAEFIYSGPHYTSAAAAAGSSCRCSAATKSDGANSECAVLGQEAPKPLLNFGGFGAVWGTP